MPKAGCPGQTGWLCPQSSEGAEGWEGTEAREAGTCAPGGCIRNGRWKWSGVRDGGPLPRSPSCRRAAQDGSEPVSPSVKWANNWALLLGCREVTCQGPGGHGATGQPVTAALRGRWAVPAQEPPLCSAPQHTQQERHSRRTEGPEGRQGEAQRRKARGTRSPPSGACALTPSGPTPSTGPLGRLQGRGSAPSASHSANTSPGEVLRVPSWSPTRRPAH